MNILWTAHTSFDINYSVFYFVPANGLDRWRHRFLQYPVIISSLVVCLEKSTAKKNARGEKRKPTKSVYRKSMIKVEQQDTGRKKENRQ